MPRPVKRAAKDSRVLREAALRNRGGRIVKTESEQSCEEDAADCIEFEADDGYSDGDVGSDSDRDVGSDRDSDRGFGSEHLTDRGKMLAATRRVQCKGGETNLSWGAKAKRLDDTFTEACA